MFDFILRQQPPLALTQHSERQRVDRRALEPDDGQPDCFTQAADLTVAPLVKREFEHDALLFPRDHLDLAGQGVTPVQGDACRHFCQLLLADGRPHGDAIGLGDVRARMHDRVCKFAVVRHQEETLGIAVETADGIDVRGRVPDQIGNAFETLLVRHCGNESARLVEHQVNRFLRRAHDLTANGDAILPRVDLVAEHGRPTVDLDHAGKDQLLRLSP